MEEKGVRAALMGAVQKAAESAHPPPQGPPANSTCSSVDTPKTKDTPTNESSKSPQETTK